MVYFRLNAQLNVAASPYGYSSSHGLQIMPHHHQSLNTTPNPFYSPRQSTTPNSSVNAATKIPLTPEQLTKLYSMGPYAISPRPTPSASTSQTPLQTPQINQFAQPFGGAYPNITSLVVRPNQSADAQYHQSPVNPHAAFDVTTGGKLEVLKFVGLTQQQINEANSTNAFTQQQQQHQQSLLYNQSIASSASISAQSDYSTYTQNASMHNSSPVQNQNQSAILRPQIGNVTNPESALVHVPKVRAMLIYFHAIA